MNVWQLFHKILIGLVMVSRKVGLMDDKEAERAVSVKQSGGQSKNTHL